MTIENKVKWSQAEKERGKKEAFAFVRNLREEVKLISWTSKQELKSFTKLVVGATFAFGLGIYLVDLVMKGVLEMLRRLFHLIFG